MSISPQASDLGAGRGRPPVVLTATKTQSTGNAITVVAAPAAGFRIVVLGVSVSAANAVGGVAALKSGAAGTIMWQCFGALSSPVVDNPGVGAKLFDVATATLLEFRNDTGGNAYCNVRYIIEQVQ